MSAPQRQSPPHNKLSRSNCITYRDAAGTNKPLGCIRLSKVLRRAGYQIHVGHVVASLFIEGPESIVFSDLGPKYHGAH